MAIPEKKERYEPTNLLKLPKPDAASNLPDINNKTLTSVDEAVMPKTFK